MPQTLVKKTLGENPSLQFLETLDSHQLMVASVQHSLLPSDGHPSFPSTLYPLLSLIKTLVIGFRAHPANSIISHFNILNLMTLAKTLFPN